MRNFAQLFQTLFNLFKLRAVKVHSLTSVQMTQINSSFEQMKGLLDDIERI